MIKRNALMCGGDRLKLWAAWDEMSQDTLRTDQDGDGVDDLFVCFHDAENAGDDDVGVGLVSGADLVLSQVGNVAAASGTPPSRQLDRSGDYFTMTTNLVDAFLANDEWLILTKLHGLTSGVFEYFFSIKKDTSHVLTFFQYDGDHTQGMLWETNQALMFPANDMLTATTYYVCMWKEAGGDVRCGWTTTKPTKLSDFATGDIAAGGDIGDYTGDSFTDYKYLYANNGGEQTLGAKVYYTILSKKSQTIIDNLS